MRFLFHSPRRLLLVVFGVTILFAAAAIAGKAWYWQRSELAHDEERATDAGPPAECQDAAVRTPCGVVYIGDEPVRYAYLPAAEPEVDATVLFDPGGPGSSVLSGQYDLREIQQTLGGQYALLAVEEPWVLQETTPGCEDAMRQFYRAARGEYEQPVDETASAVWGDCQLDDNRYGFSDTLYARAIDDIAIEQVLQIHGFVGHSFGAQRLSYLSEGATAVLQWAVITRPYPVGASLRETIDARARLVDDAVGEAGVPIGEPVAVSGRSVDVTELDYWSALAGLGYVTEDDWEQTRSAVVDGSDPSLIGNLSDQLWMRYGVDSLSPGMLAQWQEVCAVAGDLPPREAGGVAAVLDTFYAPCAGAERERERPPGGVELSEYRACVTVSPDDLVTPASLVRESFVGAEIVEVEDRSHGSLQGLDQCLARVGAGEAD